MSVLNAVWNRSTSECIVVTFLNWTEHVLYDSRQTPYDVPHGLSDYPVESVHVVDGLTIIEI